MTTQEFALFNKAHLNQIIVRVPNAEHFRKILEALRDALTDRGLTLEYDESADVSSSDSLIGQGVVLGLKDITASELVCDFIHELGHALDTPLPRELNTKWHLLTDDEKDRRRAREILAWKLGWDHACDQLGAGSLASGCARRAAHCLKTYKVTRSKRDQVEADILRRT